MELLNTRIDKGCLARAVDVEKRTVRFLAQSTALASDKLVILPNAGKKHNRDFMKNPIVTPYHMRYSMEGDPIVVGSVVETEFAKDGMYQTVQFAETDKGEQYWILYKDGHMRMVSIAWDRNDVRETDKKKMANLLNKHSIGLKAGELEQVQGVVKQYRQRDLSLVAIGADPKALARMADDGIEVASEMLDRYGLDDLDAGLSRLRREDEDPIVIRTEEPDDDEPDKSGVLVPPDYLPIHRMSKQDIKDAVRDVVRQEMENVLLGIGIDPAEHSRGVIPYKKYPLAPEGEKWDGPGEVRKADVEKLEKMCAWFDSADKEVKSSYKLPHHRANDFYTVWNGVRAAMGALLGARGGVKGITDSERKRIYSHLEKHYKEFGREAPEFREYEEDELERLFEEETDDGQTTKDGAGDGGTDQDPTPQPRRSVDLGVLYDDALAFDKGKRRRRPDLGRVLEETENEN
jgi:hypothetical protein